MKATIEQRRNPRPQPIVCRGCNGTRRLSYSDPDTQQVKYMPCLFCDSTGVQFRNPSHAEHRNLLERLAGWTWKALLAVLL